MQSQNALQNLNAISYIYDNRKIKQILGTVERVAD